MTSTALPTTRGTSRAPRVVPSFGAFVEIAPGLEGLAHVSRLALDRRVSHPRQVVAVGDEVEVTVVSVDPEKRRLALSMVESARRARDAAEFAESGETADLLARSKETKSFGTLAELLAPPKKPKREAESPACRPPSARTSRTAGRIRRRLRPRLPRRLRPR